MRRIALIAALATIGFAPRPAQAQRPQFDGGERRAARLMDRLRDEMWAFRQELDYFRRAPEYQQLIDLRYRIRNFAIEMAEAREYNEDVRGHARQMAQAARDLYHLAEHLEDRLDARNPEVRRRADALHEHAVEIRVLIGRLHELMHIDVQGGGPDGRFGDRPAPGRGRDDGR